MKKMPKYNKGITLVALVVTIVVLIILAGVSLTLVLGQNGIVTKAQKAKNDTDQASKNEQTAMDEASDQMDVMTGNKVFSKAMIAAKDNTMLSKPDNTFVKAADGNSIEIPAGFKIANDSGAIASDGIVIEDSQGNQFVWVPVASIDDYKRNDYGEEAAPYSTYMETLPEDEKTSIIKHHGFFIGRYETGDATSTTNKTYRDYNSVATNAMTIKKSQIPYNWEAKADAKTLTEGFATANSYTKTFTKLCSSYAWDTTMEFIQKRVPNYATNSPQGNYIGTEVKYTELDGTSSTKPSNTNPRVVLTGLTTPVCNIYDMGGNVAEWTTEAYADAESGPSVIRGGYYTYQSSKGAGYRMLNGKSGTPLIGFRVTMFLKD